MQNGSEAAIVIVAYQPKPGKEADLCNSRANMSLCCVPKAWRPTIRSPHAGPRTARLWRSSSGRPAERSKRTPIPPS